jgi:two-component system NarL family sensor kinase
LTCFFNTLIWQLKPVGLEHGLVQALNQYAQILNIKLTINVEGIISLSNIVEEFAHIDLMPAPNHAQDLLV